MAGSRVAEQLGTSKPCGLFGAMSWAPSCNPFHHRQMSDDTTAATPPADNSELEALRQSVAKLEAKNKELKAEKDKAREAAAETEALRTFKQEHEQQQLEAQGDYTAARQRLQEQFDTAVKARDEIITTLEARVRELEVMTPAFSALADIVHDPQLVITSKLGAQQIEREADGSVVVVDGLQRTPVADWARNLPAWMLKAPRPQGSGAPVGNRGASDVPPGTKNPFSKEHFNLTEQGRLFKTNPDLYNQLREAAR